MNESLTTLAAAGPVSSSWHLYRGSWSPFHVLWQFFAASTYAALERSVASMSFLLRRIKTQKYNRLRGRLIIIKSKCLITEEQQETSAQSESQEESLQAMLTHTEHSIVVCYSFRLNNCSFHRSRPSRPRTCTDPQNRQPLRRAVLIRRDEDLQGSWTPSTKSAHSTLQAEWLRLERTHFEPWTQHERKVQTTAKCCRLLPILQIDRGMGQASLNRWEHCREIKWIWMARMVAGLERPTQYVQVPPHEMGKSDLSRSSD